MHSEPPLDNHNPQCKLQMAIFFLLVAYCYWGGEPFLCQTLTSLPVQSEAGPGKRGRRQW